MRDLLDTITVLSESTGLAGRKPGDKFKNANGDEIVFNNIEFYPREGGKFEQSQLEALLRQLANVKWQNNKTNKTGGVAVATFNTSDGEIQYGFFKDNIKPDPTSNYIPNEVAGYRFAGRAAEKIQSGLTPQDLLTKRDNLTSADIIAQLEENPKLGPNNSLTILAKRIAQGEKFPIRFDIPQGVSFTGFRDYFCEILQPMALQVGSYTGNAGEAAEIFLGGSFAGTLISFDSAKNAGLSDSILTSNEGKTVKVSTKGGKGAQASAKNLIDSVNELSETPAGRKLIKNYKDSIDLMREIQNQGQVKAPLYLGVKYDIITQDEADTILRLRNTKPINLKDIDKMNLGKNLTKLAKGRDSDNPESVNLFYHLLASVATLAAIEVNDKTDFSKAASDILNNGALVQVYTKAKQDKDSWVLQSFDTVYPGESIKGVYLSASKNYFSTGIKGNFTFKIDRGTGKPKEDNSEPSAKKTTPDINLAKAAKQIAQGTSKPISMKPKTTTGIGREKRK
jgi:hypothetical protein